MPQTLIDFPSQSITDVYISPTAGIQAKKLVRHQSIDFELAESATAIVAVNKLIHVTRGATGTLKGFEAAIVVIADDVSRTVTVDLKKSTGGGAFATVLSSTIGFSTSSTILTPVAAVFSDTSLVDGDILQIAVTVAGGSGTQAKGLIATLNYEEAWAS